MLRGVIVAQISDMHIKRRGHILHHIPHVAQPLHRVLAAIDRLRPAPDSIIARPRGNRKNHTHAPADTVYYLRTRPPAAGAEVARYARAGFRGIPEAFSCIGASRVPALRRRWSVSLKNPLR